MNPPVVVFAYNRPEKLSVLLESLLLAAYEGPIRIFLDGPKLNVTDVNHAATQRVAEDFCESRPDAELVARTGNMGLYENITSALDGIFAKYDSAIVLEDDCIPTSDFFGYMVEALNAYKDQYVLCISGTNLGLSCMDARSNSFFSHLPVTWGWATWSKKWQAFRSWEASNYPIPKVRDSKVILGTSGLVSKSILFWTMSNLHGKDSWAVPFEVFSRSNGYLNLVTRPSLISNIGQGPDATNTHSTPINYRKRLNSKVNPVLPKIVKRGAAQDFFHEFELLLGWILFVCLHPLYVITRLVKSFSSRPK